MEKTIFHNSDEEPLDNQMILCMTGFGPFICGPNNTYFKETVKHFGIKQWAYINDIMEPTESPFIVSGVLKAGELGGSNRIIRVTRTDGSEVDFIISIDKAVNKYCFVNLTKNHVCTCRFDSYEDAIKDMESQEKVVSWKYLK